MKDGGSVGVDRTGSGIVKVSQSRIRNWRTCKRQHHYKYVENIKPKRVKRPFQFGRIVHSMVEAYANADDPFEVLDGIQMDKKAMFRAEEEMYGNIIEDIRAIMTEYFEHWPEDSFVYLRRGGRSAEFKFGIELEPGIVFSGIIDAAAKARKMKWLVEHKSFKRKPNDDERWRNVQACVYMRANDMLGWFKGVEGMAWDYIKSIPPKDPVILQSGKVSAAAKSLTLPAKAIQYFEANDIPVETEGVAEFLKACEAERAEYFSRIFMPVSRTVVDDVWDDFLVSAREVAELGDTRKERNIGRHCSWCDYEPLCRAAMQGSDVDFIKEREYIARDTEEHEAYGNEAEEG